MNLKNYSVYGTAFLLITVASLALSDLTLLPLIRLQLKHPQVFNYLLLALTLFWFILRIILQFRQERPDAHSTITAALKATGRVAIQAVGTLGKFLRFLLLFALFITALALALATNSRLLLS